MDKKRKSELNTFGKVVSRNVGSVSETAKIAFKRGRSGAIGWISGVIYVRKMEEDSDG